MADNIKEKSGAFPVRDGAALQDAGLEAYARVALELNGLSLSQADVALTIAEFGRGLDIARPLLDFELPDGLDQAGVFRL